MTASPTMEKRFTYSLTKYLLYALLLTPLWVWSIFLFPFITSKILYFRVLLELALLFYIPLVLEFPEIRPKWNWILKSVWLYVAIVIATSLLGMDFNRSFWGSIERGEGIITLVHFAVYFTILTGFFRSRQEWRRYLVFAVLTTAVVALYGAGQLACVNSSYDPSYRSSCDFFVQTGGGTRISATIGNAAFFAAYMIFGVFLTLYLLRDSQSLGQKGFWWGVLLFELIMIYQSQTRGAVLAILLALIFYNGFNIFFAQRKFIRIASGLLLLAIIGFGVAVFFNRESAWVSSSSTLKRLATISTLDITTQSRFDTWRASWEAWHNRFWTGYGYENYNLAFNKFFPERIYKDQGSQIWFDRAHNIFLDVGVTSGILGILAYVTIFVVVFWMIFRMLRDVTLKMDKKIPLLLGATLLAYGIQNFFVFDTQATYLMFFLCLALISFWQNQVFLHNEKKSAQSYQTGYLLPSFLAVFILITVYFVNIEPARANYFATQGIRVTKLQQYSQIKLMFARALSYGTYMDQEIRQRLVDNSLEAINSGQLNDSETQELYEFMLQELEKSLAESPQDVKNYLYLMNFFNRFPGNPNLIDRNIVLGQKALALSPTRSQIYFELGQAYFYKQDFETGLENFQKGVALNPDTKEAQLNLLLAAIIAGKEDLVQEQFEVITKELKRRINSRDYQSLARAYIQVKNFSEATNMYLQALSFEPDNLQLLGALVATYGELCDLENVQHYLDETVRRDPNFTIKGIEFKRSLEEKCGK